MIRSRALALLLVAGAVQAQDTQQRAAQAWFAQNWTRAAELYAAIVQQTPDAPAAHFRLGSSLIALQRFAEARTHLETAERLGTPASQVAYRLALIHAARGERDAAFTQLQRASGAGLGSIPPGTESALAPLKQDSRYAEFVAALDRNARPCAHDPRFREFDFWLGTWDVRPRGQPAAPPSRNEITKVHAGCVLLESYSAGAYTGQSFNIYDRTRGEWNQTWVDVTGGLHVYWGALRDGNMVYEGEMPDPAAPRQRVRTRLTFFPTAPDTVRQFSESTRDGGKTWTVNYDFIYTRVRP